MPPSKAFRSRRPLRLVLTLHCFTYTLQIVCRQLTVMQMILFDRRASEFSPENTTDCLPPLWNEPGFAYL